MKKRELWMLMALAAVQFTNILDFMIMAPLGPELMRSLKINTQQFGLILSVYTISAGISGFISAFFADRFDRKELLWKVYIGFIIGTLFCAMSPNFEILLVSRLVTGAFGGILGATCMSIVSDTIPLERRGQGMGVLMASFSLASVLGIPFGLALVQYFNNLGWHAPFFAVVAMGLPVLALVSIYVPPVRDHIAKKELRPGPMTIIRNVVSDTPQLWAILLMSLMMFGQFMIVPFIAQSMVFNVGIAESDLPQIYFFGGLATFFTGPIIGRISDKLGRKSVFVVVSILSTVPIYFIANLGHVAMWMALVATTAFFVLSSGRGIVASSLVSNTVTPQQRGSFMSIASSVQQLAAGIATFIGGTIVHQGAGGRLEDLATVGFLAIFTSLVAVALVSRIRQLPVMPLAGLPAESEEPLAQSASA